MPVRAVIFDMYETLVTHYGCPLYFGEEMALDAGVEPAAFLPLWRATDSARTCGRQTLEETLRAILTPMGVRREVQAAVAEKRRSTKAALFRHMHPEILPMLQAIRKRGVSVGLISNCYEEEACAIRKSVLFPYFDAVCLSCREGVAKPQEEIYRRCLQRLSLPPEVCLYVGDGGSRELETAQALGMIPLQAMWYLSPRGIAPKDGYRQAQSPLEVISFLS